MSTRTPSPQDTCERCGAEPDPASPTGRGPASAAAPPEAAEPLTHCEWCGAEYPVPGDD